MLVSDVGSLWPGFGCHHDVDVGVDVAVVSVRGVLDVDARRCETSWHVACCHDVGLVLQSYHAGMRHQVSLDWMLAWL